MWILVGVFSILLVAAYIFKFCISRRFWISLLSALSAFFLLLTFYNPQHVQYILNISSARVAYDVNWGSTVVNRNFDTITVPDIPYLQNFIRTTTEGLRPAGSMHSYSPLVSTLGCRYVIDIRKLDEIVFYNGSHIRAGAGATIESIQQHLFIYKKTFRGIGSYTGQTLAGGFSTSLAGIEMVAFSQFATWAKTVNAFGDTVEWNDLYYLRDSMGMMGVIVELEFQVFDNYDLEATIHSSSVEDLISIGSSENVDAFDSLTTLYADHASITSVSYQRVGGTSIVRGDEIKIDDNILNLVDYFVTPLTFVVPFYNFLPLIDKNIINKDEQLATIAQDTHAYSLTMIDYRIPRSNCSAFFSRLVANPQDGIVRIKLLDSRNDACLAYNQAMCKIELYVPAHKNIITYERLAWEYGGYSHWGKYFRGDITEQLKRFPCWTKFEEMRKLQDPTDRFLNSFLRGEDYQYWHGGGRLWIFYIIFIIILVIHPIWFTYESVEYIIKRKRLKKQPEIQVADLVSDTEKTGLLDDPTYPGYVHRHKRESLQTGGSLFKDVKIVFHIMAI
jgi:FAD/FMN-containing dehydrogenase